LPAGFWEASATSLLYSQAVDIYKRPVQVERSRDFDFIHYLIRLDIDIGGQGLQPAG